MDRIPFLPHFTPSSNATLQPWGQYRVVNKKVNVCFLQAGYLEQIPAFEKNLFYPPCICVPPKRAERGGGLAGWRRFTVCSCTRGKTAFFHLLFERRCTTDDSGRVGGGNSSVGLWRRGETRATQEGRRKKPAKVGWRIRRPFARALSRSPLLLPPTKDFKTPRALELNRSSKEENQLEIGKIVVPPLFRPLGIDEKERKERGNNRWLLKVP